MLNWIVFHFSFLGSVNAILWSLYGYASHEYADVITKQFYSYDGEERIIKVNKHHLTESTGYVIYGLTNILMGVIFKTFFIALVLNMFDTLTVCIQPLWDGNWCEANASECLEK